MFKLIIFILYQSRTKFIIYITKQCSVTRQRILGWQSYSFHFINEIIFNLSFVSSLHVLVLFNGYLLHFKPVHAFFIIMLQVKVIDLIIGRESKISLIFRNLRNLM